MPLPGSASPRRAGGPPPSPSRSKTNGRNASIYGVADRGPLEADAKGHFRPQPVEVGAFRLLLGSLFVADIRTGDHDGPIATATFTTIGDYLERYRLATERFEVLPAPADATR